MALDRTLNLAEYTNEQHELPLVTSRSTTHSFLQEAFSKSKQAIEVCFDKTLPADDAVILDATMGFNARLRQNMLPAITESALIISCTIANACLLATETSWYRNPLLYFPALMALNTGLRMLPAEKIVGEEKVIKYRRAVRAIRSALFAFADCNTRRLLLHEGGHALFALLLYQHSHPTIEILPGIIGYRGRTVISSQDHTSVGAALGDESSKLLMLGMGTGVTMITDYISLIAAQTLSDDYPELRSFLRSAVFAGILYNMEYVLSAYGDCGTSFHDFCQLKQEGISPATVTAIIVGSMLLIQLLLSGISHCRRSVESKANADDIALEDVHIAENEEEVAETESLLRPRIT